MFSHSLLNILCVVAFELNIVLKNPAEQKHSFSLHALFKVNLSQTVKHILLKLKCMKKENNLKEATKQSTLVIYT